MKILIILFFILIGIIFSLYIYAYFSPAININSANSYYLYDNKDNVIYQGSNSSEWVSLDNIDNKVKEYIINVEDKNFYKHFGFDILRIISAMFNNIKAGKIVEGASSISQQYVKNLYLDFDKNWERKLEEALLTIKLETHYSKDQILEGYLNTIYFGNGIYGIKDASLYYFNKDISDLTTEEAIMLVGIPKSPNNYNPLANENASKKRFNTVKKVLLDNNVIDDDNISYDNLVITGEHKTYSLNTLMYYQDAVLNELKKIDTIPKSLLDDGGLRIFTNLDIDTQTRMEESIKENNIDDDNQLSSIVVEPTTGKILALAGGKNYLKSQYNRVLNSKRQVGSTIKPFLYYAALNNGMTEASTFKSEKTSFVFAENKEYSPSNYGNIYANKDITMASALSYSDNVYAVKTHLFLGESTLVNTLKTCGLKEELLPNPSLALGAQEINMLDYIGAYTALASGGYYSKPYFIRRVEDINGNVLYEYNNESKQVLDESITFILNEMLTNTYNYNFVDYTSPTVIYLNGKLDRKYALKSGTTDNDYWLVGYNKDVLMINWAGNDNNKDVPKTYSKIIKNIWLDTVTSYEKDKEDTWYNKPENVVAIPINPKTGKYDAKSKNLFYFLTGTELNYLK